MSYVITLSYEHVQDQEANPEQDQEANPITASFQVRKEKEKKVDVYKIQFHSAVITVVFPVYIHST